MPQSSSCAHSDCPLLLVPIEPPVEQASSVTSRKRPRMPEPFDDDAKRSFQMTVCDCDCCEQVLCLGDANVLECGHLVHEACIRGYANWDFIHCQACASNKKSEDEMPKRCYPLLPLVVADNMSKELRMYYAEAHTGWKAEQFMTFTGKFFAVHHTSIVQYLLAYYDHLQKAAQVKITGRAMPDPITMPMQLMDLIPPMSEEMQKWTENLVRIELNQQEFTSYETDPPIQLCTSQLPGDFDTDDIREVVEDTRQRLVNILQRRRHKRESYADYRARKPHLNKRTTV